MSIRSVLLSDPDALFELRTRRLRSRGRMRRTVLGRTDGRAQRSIQITSERARGHSEDLRHTPSARSRHHSPRETPRSLARTFGSDTRVSSDVLSRGAPSFHPYDALHRLSVSVRHLDLSLLLPAFEGVPGRIAHRAAYAGHRVRFCHRPSGHRSGTSRRAYSGRSQAPSRILRIPDAGGRSSGSAHRASKAVDEGRRGAVCLALPRAPRHPTFQGRIEEAVRAPVACLE